MKHSSGKGSEDYYWHFPLLEWAKKLGGGLSRDWLRGKGLKIMVHIKSFIIQKESAKMLDLKQIRSENDKLCQRLSYLDICHIMLELVQKTFFKVGKNLTLKRKIL